MVPQTITTVNAVAAMLASYTFLGHVCYASFKSLMINVIS